MSRQHVNGRQAPQPKQHFFFFLNPTIKESAFDNPLTEYLTVQTGLSSVSFKVTNALLVAKASHLLIFVLFFAGTNIL